jgi:hypothetical protein
MRNVLLIIGVLLVMLTMVGCMPGPNTLEDTPDEGGDVAGFFMGLWHGFISPITFVVSIFSPDTTVYEVHNSGAWYDLGFLLGIGMISGGSGGGAARATQKRDVG